jgi:hypothetical protein
LRGFCYLLEEHGLPKGDFDKAEKLITACRKNGLLTIDFTAEDNARSEDNSEILDCPDPNQFAKHLTSSLHDWSHYTPVSFWDFQPIYLYMVVEKIDLKSLFLPICEQYHVPIRNARGWSDLNLRAGIMRRFQEHEAKGRKCVLLYGGDFDPPGLEMPKRLPEQFQELEEAVGWSPANLIIDRFCLNYDFIQKHKLSWIDGLKTGSEEDLADPDHKRHNADYVQSYIKKYGERKCEANALVVRPDAGRELCRASITKYLSMDGIKKYQEALAQEREKLKAVLPQAVRMELEKLTGAGPSLQ